MEKKFTVEGNKLIVTVESSDKLWLPDKESHEGKNYIGKYTQTTKQIIEIDKAHVLRGFIAGEKVKAEEQLSGISERLEDLKDVNEKELDADLIKAVKETIMKGSKERRTHLTALSGHIEKVAMKQQLLIQSEVIDKELTRITKELSDLDKALE